MFFMAKMKYWNAITWEVVGTDADKVGLKDNNNLFQANNVEDALVEIKQDFNSHLANYVKQVPYGVATGSANTYAVTLSPAPTAYVEGLAIAVKINVDNTGASTLNINGLGAKAIKKPNGNNVSAGNLKAGSIYTLRYNGTNFILQGSDAAGNATPGDVLSGKTFSNDQGEQVGAMPNRGAVIITPGTTNQTIAAGYHNGGGYVKGDANLIASNIKSGVSIFGVVGTSKAVAQLSKLDTGVVNIPVSRRTDPDWVQLVSVSGAGIVDHITAYIKSPSNASYMQVQVIVDGITILDHTFSAPAKDTATQEYDVSALFTSSLIVRINHYNDGNSLGDFGSTCRVTYFF